MVTLVMCFPAPAAVFRPSRAYNTFEGTLEKKLFWIIFLGLSLLADVFLPFFWGMAATFPIFVFSWWVVYRSGWLC